MPVKPAQLAVLNDAIKKAGGMFALARKLNITPDAVQKWRTNGVPVERAKQLEQLSGVPRAKLRPDHFA